MKTTRSVLAALVVVLLVATFAPLPAAQKNPAATNTTTLNNPTQAFMEAALGLPFLAPMALSASAPIISVTVDTLATPDYACKLTSQSPADWTKMSGRQDFDARWVLQNTGLKTWYKANTDYKYLSIRSNGIPKILHTRGSRYDLPVDVAPLKKITIVVDMMAPKYNGSYTWYVEKWGLVDGNSVFCRFSMAIVVNR